MHHFELSPRLRSVADLVPQGARFADVGTDHAHLPIWLLLHGVIDRAIASDLREGPLENARQSAAHYDVADKITFRRSNGLWGITPEEVDTIAIAGMGGETIAVILEDCDWASAGRHRFILQPMTAHEALRSWLTQNGFSILREVLTREGEAIYLTLLAVPGPSKPLSLAECFVGRQERATVDPLRRDYLEQMILRTDKALAGIQHSRKPNDIMRAVEMRILAKQLGEMEQELTSWQQ